MAVGSCFQEFINGRHKNSAFTLSATLLISLPGRVILFVKVKSVFERIQCSHNMFLKEIADS